MKLSTFKEHLAGLDEVHFQLPDGSYVPQHFHVTEVGLITRHFIDCGSTERKEQTINFQLWQAEDYDHRLAPQKLMRIIEVSKKAIGNNDLEVEVEYQQATIGKYGVAFNGKDFVLVATHTACLAQDSCGIPTEKIKRPLSELKMAASSSCCAPDSKCC